VCASQIDCHDSPYELKINMDEKWTPSVVNPGGYGGRDPQSLKWGLGGMVPCLSEGRTFRFQNGLTPLWTRNVNL
jgi:hypothetical protein